MAAFTRVPPEFAPAAALAAAALAGWPAGQPVRLAKRTSNLFRPRVRPPAQLDLSAFAGVYTVDAERRVATVGGLTTYAELVDGTLPHGLVPLCVPQLRTITLGGAVAGLGIEAASFRNGLPHESVLAMDVLTGVGQVVRTAPDGPYQDLFFGFPNSYGTLGYALRLDIELEPVTPQICLRHVRFGSAAALAAAVDRIVADRRWEGEQVDYVDGTVFAADELYLTLGRYTGELGACSDYTGSQIYYQSIRRRTTDRLTTLAYLWRWDTDWFWCSRALGAQHPLVRRLWPRSRLRSDTYWRLVAFERRHDLTNRWAHLRGRPRREAVVQDVEVPVAALPEFLDFFARQVGISPVWLCPLRQRHPGRQWPLYRFASDQTYVNVGFWSTVAVPDGVDPAAGTINRRIEQAVTAMGGRKSLYSTSYYPRDEFDRLYGGSTYTQLKDRYDPGRRLLELYDKCVRSR